MDLAMPRLDGAAASAEIRRIAPDARILLMSGFGEEEAIQRFAVQSPAAFLQKPFSADALFNRLGRILAAPAPKS